MALDNLPLDISKDIMPSKGSRIGEYLKDTIEGVISTHVGLPTASIPGNAIGSFLPKAAMTTVSNAGAVSAIGSKIPSVAMAQGHTVGPGVTSSFAAKGTGVASSFALGTTLISAMLALPSVMKILKSPKLHSGEKEFGKAYFEQLSETGDPEIAMAKARMQFPNEGNDSIRDVLEAYTNGRSIPTSYNIELGLTREEKVSTVTLLGMGKLVESGELTEAQVEEQLRRIHPPLADPNNAKYFLTPKNEYHKLEVKPVSYVNEWTRENPSFSAKDLAVSGGTQVSYNPTFQGEPFGMGNPVTITGRVPSEKELLKEIDILNHFVNQSEFDNDPYNTSDAFRGVNPQDYKGKLQALKHLQKNLFPRDMSDGGVSQYSSVNPEYSPSYRGKTSASNLSRVGIIFGDGSKPQMGYKTTSSQNYADQLSSLRNLGSNTSLVNQYAEEFDKSFREAGRGDITFNSKAFQSVIGMPDSDKANEFTEQQLAGVMVNNFDKIFYLNDRESGSSALVRSEVIKRLMNENPKLKHLMDKFKGEIIKPFASEIKKENFGEFDPNAGVINRPIKELPNQAIVRETLTSFATNTGPRSTGLLGAADVPKDNPLDSFYAEYSNNPIAMRILAEETGKHSVPYANPNSPWYDAERAKTAKPSYWTLYMGAGKAKERLEREGITKTAFAPTNSPPTNSRNLPAFNPPDITEAVKNNPAGGPPAFAPQPNSNNSAPAPLTKKQISLPGILPPRASEPFKGFSGDMFGGLATTQTARESVNAFSVLNPQQQASKLSEGAAHIRKMGIDNPIFGNDPSMRALRQRTLDLSP